MNPIVIVVLSAVALSQNLFAEDKLLVRRYREGEQLVYRMKATNDNSSYEISASGIVKIDSGRKFFEEYTWSWPSASRFHQILSLEPVRPPAMPNLRDVDPSVIGPITDFLTIYADLWLATKIGSLSKPGDHVEHKLDHPVSWADGTFVLVGEDSIYFDITLLRADRIANVATLLVKHVPPKEPLIQVPAEWMRAPVADTSNNWVQVKKKNGKFEAAIGKETFDVTINVSLIDGKILEANIKNPVEMIERSCDDEALTRCNEPRIRKIFREVEISLEH